MTSSKALRYSIAFVSLVCVVACVHDPDDLIIDTTPQLAAGILCDADSVYFQNDILPILESYCAYSGCHGDGSAEEDVDLEGYTNTIETGGVGPGDAANSELYQVLVDTGGDIMPPVDDGGPLAQELIDLIELWINQGALNNSCEGCSEGDVTWSLTVQPLMVSSCQGCHSGVDPDGGVALENYTDVMSIALSGSLMGTVTESDGYELMPYQANALMDCQIDQLQDWVDQGAPEN